MPKIWTLSRLLPLDLVLTVDFMVSNDSISSTVYLYVERISEGAPNLVHQLLIAAARLVTRNSTFVFEFLILMIKHA